MDPPELARPDATFLRRQVEAWRDREGYDPSDFVLTSFTRAAAAVLAGRVPVPADRIATLHALCYRGLGRLPIAESGPLRKQWDEDCANTGLGVYQVGKTPDLEEGVYHERIQQGEPGAMLAAYSLWRSTGRTNAYLEEYTRAFAKRWEGFKADTGSIDFTDMLELGLRELSACPGNPAVLMIDEAADLSPLQWRLADQWGARCERVIVAGDPAQSLFGWLGASPDRLLSPVDATERRVLGQSWRLSPEVQSYAEAWLAQHSAPMMEGRIYRPRADGAGTVRRSGATWEHPDELLEQIREQIDAGKTTMILASCAYMLAPTLRMLRECGILFHNPYRRRNGAWNPGSPEGTAAAVSYVMREGVSWWSWGQHLPAACFGGTKRAAATLPVEHALTEAAYQHARVGDVPWLRRTILKNPALDYALSCAENLSLAGEPMVTIGTIHSSKGGEADCAVLYPDISGSGYHEANGSVAGHDALVRMMYVGLTRSLGDVVLCDPVQPRTAVWWP